MKVFVLYEHDYEDSGIKAIYSSQSLAESAMKSIIASAEKRIEEAQARGQCGYGEPPCLTVDEFDVLGQADVT
jgi:hypothetical protein